MPTFYGAVDLVKNELRNAVVQNLGTAPATPSAGQLYYDTAAHVLYWYNGTAWVAAQGAGALTPAATVTTQAVGDAPIVGTSVNYAREDHRHGREAFAATVTAETAFGQASAVGTATTLAHADHTHGTPTHDAAAHSAISLSALAAPTGALSMGSQRVANVQDPTNPQDAATMNYVLAQLQGLTWKTPCRIATTANVGLSGLAAIDGVTPVVNDRILVKNQTTASANGIYVAAGGGWIRATDADTSAELVNAAVFVSEGTTQADTAWVQTTNAPITVGTTNVVFVQFGAAAGYAAGNGLTLTGNVFAVGAGTGILATAGLTSVDSTVVALKSDLTTVVRKYAAALTGTASPETVTHNLNTQDVDVIVRNGASPYTAVQVDWDAATVNTITIRYAPNLGAGYRVTVQG